MIIEEWRDYPGFEDVIEISNFGRARRKARIGYKMKVIPAKILKITGNTFCTSINCTPHTFKVKEAVARAFVPLPAGADIDKLIVVTINNKRDYSAENLRWVTLKEFEESQNKPIANKMIKRSADAIIQMRLDGSIVRRYRNMEEVLSVHPKWNKVDILMSLTKFLPDAYGYQWMYELA